MICRAGLQTRPTFRYSAGVLDPAPEIPPSSPLDPPDTPGVQEPPPTLPIERLGALIEVFLCSGLPTQLLVFQALTSFGMASHADDGGWSPAFIISMALIDMVCVLLLIGVFLRAHREALSDFVVGPRRPLREVLLGIVCIPAAFVLVVVILAAILAIRPSLHNVTVNPFERMLQTPRDAAIFAVVVMLAGGVREEVQRAFIVRRFNQYLGGAMVGIAVYSVIFGLGHVEQGYAAAIATGSLGAGWGVLYWRRQSVIAPIVSHAGFNVAQLVKYVSFVR
jgi:membrane protease YdiL (CAAX protease family)